MVLESMVRSMVVLTAAIDIDFLLPILSLSSAIALALSSTLSGFTIIELSTFSTSQLNFLLFREIENGAITIIDVPPRSI